MTIPETMKAFLHDNNAEGGMRWCGDHPVPKPDTANGQILIKVKAASINPIDYKLQHVPIIGRKVQQTPVGWDVCGEVVEAGDDSRFKVGDDVAGHATTGSLCEYTIVESDNVTKISESVIGAGEAAALNVAGVTSYDCVINECQARPGQHGLIIGGAGGTGSFAVQIAKIMDVRSTVVCGKRSSEICKSLGADTTVDYGVEGFTVAGSVECGTFDFVYDTVTSPEDTDYYPDARKALKKNGKYVAINGSGWQWIKMLLSSVLFRSYVSLEPSDYHLYLKPTRGCGEKIAQLHKWIEEGKMKPVATTMMSFSEENCRKGFEQLKSRSTKGKIAFSMN